VEIILSMEATAPEIEDGRETETNWIKASYPQPLIPKEYFENQKSMPRNIWNIDCEYFEETNSLQQRYSTLSKNIALILISFILAEDSRIELEN